MLGQEVLRIDARELVDFAKLRLPKIKSQIPYAMAGALNDCMYASRAAVIQEMAKRFDRPTPWVMHSLRYQKSAYASLLKARRRTLHRLAAEWFEGRDPILRAQHLDRAEDERAASAYHEAAAAQRAAHHAEVALALAERGRDLAQRPDERHALACLKGELQRDLGDIAGSIATYRAALAAAPDDIAKCQARLGLAQGLRVSEGLEEALTLLDMAQQDAERNNLLSELARLHHLRGNIFFPLGKIEGCRIEHERGLGYARRSGSAEAEARALGGLADAAYAQGRMRSAFAHFSRCVELAQAHGFGRIEVANRSMVGFSRIYLNEPRPAREDCAAAARAAAMVAQPRAEMLAETGGIYASYELGDYAAMADHLKREILLIRLLGAQRFEAQNLEMQGRRLLHLGAPAEAADCLRAALAICREVGMGFCDRRCLALSLAPSRTTVSATAFSPRARSSCAVARSATITFGSIATPSRRVSRPVTWQARCAMPSSSKPTSFQSPCLGLTS
jgi:tetratricopeptide (TPR) repeat protein